MDTENETHPLLHDFENETWRSRTRKRCIRIPSEAAITGLILGVFFVVVTLLIVLENMEKTKKDDISIDDKLLASPSFNGKVPGKSWQDEKLLKLDKINKDWKKVSDQSGSSKYNKMQKDKSWQDEKQRKFDKVNKGWKVLPNISGKRVNRWDDDLNEDMKDRIDPKQISIVGDEYGREEDDRWSSYFSSEARDPNAQVDSDKDMGEIVNLLQSPMIKREKINEEWSRLTGLGWKDYEIRKALLKVLLEKKDELNGTGIENVLRSPMNLDELWDEINKSWQEKVEEGRAEKEYRRLIHSKDAKDQENIKDAWKDKMSELQSPKATAKKEAREDEGWENLSRQGWKNKDIEEALFNAWKEKNKEKNILMSPMNFQSLFEKAGDFIKNVIQQKDNKIMDKTGSGTKSFLLSPSNLNALKSAMETSKKYKKDYKKKSEDGESENDSSPILKDFIDFIMEKIKEQQKDKMDDNTDKNNNGSTDIQYSSLNLDDFIQNIITEAMKDHEKGNKDAMDDKKSTNDAWKNKMNNLETTKTSDQKWKTINDHWKTLIEHERNSYFGKNDGSRTTTSDHSDQKILMSYGKMKWDNVDNGYKKLSTNGWNDKDLKDAVDQASRDGEQIMEAAMGLNDMKWKKVNDGYKKTYNKS